MFNKLIIIGNITRNLDLVELPNNELVAKSSIATNIEYQLSNGSTKKEDCYIDFNVYGNIAKDANKYLKKGSKVLFEGVLVHEKWNTKENHSRNKHTFRVVSITYLDKRKN